MIKKPILSFILLLFYWVTGLSQTGELINIYWQKDVKQRIYSKETVDIYPVFKNSLNIPEWGLMPCLFKEISLSASQSVKLNILETEVDTIEFSGEKHYSDEDVLTGKWQIKTDYLNGKASVYILPLKKEGNKIIRLKKFLLKVQIIDNGREVKNRFIPSYTDESVLNTGEWYKIGITKTGVYKIGYDDLEKMGINVAGLNPRFIRIYGQYNGMLPEANSEPRTDDLIEDAIKVIGEDDGVFNKGDYILFFGQGPLIWKINEMTGNATHQNNLYSDTVYYFLNFDKGIGKRITKNSQPQEEAADIITSFLDYDVIDNDKVNLLSSGKLWVGEVFDKDTTSRIFNFYFPNRIKSKQAYIKMQVLAKGVAYSYYSLFVNDNNLVDSAVILSTPPNSRFYAKKISRAKNFTDPSDTLKVKIDFSGDDELNTGWLDYIEINTFCSLKWRGTQMVFSNPLGLDSNEVDLYKFDNTPGNFYIWDITDKTNIYEQDYNLINDTAIFKSKGNLEKSFIIFDNNNLYSPVSYKKTENQNLHGIGEANLVIVVPDFLMPEAKILADIHYNHDNLKSVIVTPEQIYNEFSSGSQDISAIRDFMRMMYLKGLFGNKPPYLLFFGDGSFDYKDRIPDNTNLIPVFESSESLQKTATYGTDDFYGLLDEDEGLNASGDLDMGIGRFPLSTTKEAEAVINKINNYLTNSAETMQDWRNTICFVADDEDLNLHLDQAEGLTYIVDTAYPVFNVNKIYIDAYARQKTSSGYRYPEVNVAIDKQVEEGTLIMNYTGHGGLDGWAIEHILTLPQIREYNNFDKLPLFITATCEFSRFDDPEFFSAGEQLFLNENGGGIALLTTTRLAFAHANVILNRRIYLNLKNTEGNELPRLGDLMRMAKTPSHTNFLNFSLLGDPALRLAFPHYDVITESVINEDGKDIDTITALSKITIKGSITNNGETVNNFNGYLYPKIYDKKSKYITRANSPKSIKQQFSFFDKVLFDGKVTVKNGKFEFSFFVSDEMNHEPGKGKISYYAVDTVNFIDATGYDLNAVMGGVNENAAEDNEGPEIDIKINDDGFTDGDAVGKNSLLFARLSDPSGINYTGLGLGHDITLTIDDDFANTIIVNHLFKIDLDRYDSGTLTYSLENLSPGSHKITLKAWDLRGNSSEKSVEFFIDETERIRFKNFVAYPNPFIDKIIFRLESNLQKKCDITVNIYDINGRKIGGETKNEYLQYLSVIEFDWNKNVRSYGKQMNGVFFYEVIIEDENGFGQRFTGKIIKVPDS